MFNFKSQLDSVRLTQECTSIKIATTATNTTTITFFKKNFCKKIRTLDRLHFMKLLNAAWSPWNTNVQWGLRG